MGVKTAISFDEYVYESAERQQNATAYLAWEADAHPNGLDEVDEASAAASLDGAEW